MSDMIGPLGVTTWQCTCPHNEQAPPCIKCDK